eukprot:TRINITY_DN21017_c0_g1_i1.p1 TRINITY_DN21017_c0_g1~~TRINITY_DN21017_c0_g1_i1.p1  ORF type:complete len:579 (+),score=114.63 TRINITY_DN21017_c0_g1_i1:47-1783(+)
MKGSTLLRGWAAVSVVLTLIVLFLQLGRGDSDRNVVITPPVGEAAKDGDKDAGKVEQSPKSAVKSVLDPAEVKVISPPSNEYRGVPGGWQGECPKKYPNLAIRFLEPTIPQTAIGKDKDWKDWKLPHEVEDEYSNDNRYDLPPNWESKVTRLGKQWYHVSNFCIKEGKITLFSKTMGVATDESFTTVQRKKKFNLYNEFTRHNNRLSYYIENVPYRLPGPLVDNPAWILSFWCQDLFHSTLTLMPAHAIKKWNNSDIYVSISKPKSPCHQKLGSQVSWDESYNPMWGNDNQFSYAGNPYWRMYRVITDKPWRIRPLGTHNFYNNRARCYSEGFVDKKWFIQVTRQEAVDYANHHLRNFGIERTKRECRREEGGYRMTLINRQGKTRRLANIQEVAEAALCYGFNVTVVSFERFDLKEQIEIIANTDLLVGMHGNGLIWTMFQEIGGYEIEIMGSWYERYARLWGNGYNNTNTFDKFGKKGNEWVPFHADMKQVAPALRRAKVHLDSTACDKAPLPSMSETHQNVWEAILIRNHPELALPPHKRAEYLKKIKQQKEEKPEAKATDDTANSDASEDGAEK